MNDLILILKSGNANVKLEVSGEDLLEFSNELINRAKSELAAAVAKGKLVYSHVGYTPGTEAEYIETIKALKK